MTEKKIVNGVDVRKCKHFKAWYESRPNGFGGITIENYCYLYEDNCEKYPQCLYRSNQLQQLETQLKRKEQECEELNERTVSIIYSLTGGRLSYSTYTLEGCADAYRDQLSIDVERATKELQEENETLKQKVNTLEQALDEIEKNLKGYCKNMCMAETKETCESCQNTEILDIINKVRKSNGSIYKNS